MKLEPGSKLGPYEIIAPIGAGGMGEVYRAHDPQLGRDIAIKVLPENLSYRKDRLARFENEARLASSLNHPNIVTIHSMGWENERCYIAMELIEGRTLQEMMNEGALPAEQAVKIFAQVADGLARAHEADIIHRDLKPKNIMVTRGGHAKILDFGLSKLIRSNVDSEAPTKSTVIATDPPEGLTKPGVVLGTVEYMSPEQAAGRSVDYRSDQFSMGSLMYAVLTGNLPFHRESEIQTLNQIIEGEPRSLDRLNPGVPHALQEVVRRCLMKNPGERYASTRELAQELEKLELEGKMLLRRWTRRDWIRVSLGLLILLVVAGGVWMWSHSPYRPKKAAEDWYQKGVAAMHSMTFDSAQRAFSQAVAMDPKFALAKASLARAYEEMEYTDQATKQMMQAMNTRQETHLSGTDEKRFEVLQFIVMHQYREAASLLQELEKNADKKDKAAAALESGWLAEKLGDTEGAAAAYERALQMNRNFAAAHLRLGYIQQRRAEDQSALESFTRAEELYRDSSDSEGITETLYQRASFLNRRSRGEEAMASIDTAIAIAHGLKRRYQEIRLQLLQSAVLRKLGENDQASELAQQAIDTALKNRMDNLAASGRMALGNAFFNSGDFIAAEKNFGDTLDIAQRGKVLHYEALALLSLGSLFEMESRPLQARQYVEEAIPLFERAGYRRESVQAMAVRGGIRCQLGLYDESIEILRRALVDVAQLEDTGIEVQIRDRLVDTLLARGNWPEALKESELSASLDSGVYARLNCAGLYWRLGRRPEAERSLAAVEPLLRDGSDPFALSLFRLRQAELAYAEDRFEKAKTDARRAISAVPGSGDPSEMEARVIEALASMRASRREKDIQSAFQLVQDLEESRLERNAASARLLIAEALLDIGRPETAKTMALKALEFFEQRGVWESAWRAHLAAARASQEEADIFTHKNGAREDLVKLREMWSAKDIDGYLERIDIKPIYAYLNS